MKHNQPVPFMMSMGTVWGAGEYGQGKSSNSCLLICYLSYEVLSLNYEVTWKP